MNIKKIVKLFDTGNCNVVGLRGTGKDMLTANVVCRRRKPYVSNVDYGGVHFPLIMQQFDCGKNVYDNFINGQVKPYRFPYPDGTDIYISDCGVYFPAQYCNELNKKYGYFSTFMALSRHLGDCNVHFNVQNLNRCWDKIREQSDQYILCNRCIVFFRKYVIQIVTIYELYDSCVKRVPPFSIPRPLLNPNRKLQWDLAKASYDVSYGSIERKFLLYKNRSNYDTRIFKKILEEGAVE